MGTNYYLAKAPCKECGRPHEERHIGKSSAGWVFAMRVYPTENIFGIEDWLPLILAEGACIRDEYGKPKDPLELLRTIAMRRGGNTPTAQWLHENQAVCGPYNLARAFGHRVRNGGGTYDYHEGEFS